MSLREGVVYFELRNGGKRRALVKSKFQYNDGLFHRVNTIFF
jgi:hypothetical protein